MSRQCRVGKSSTRVLFFSVVAVLLASCSTIKKVGNDFNDLAQGLRGQDANQTLQFLGGVAADEPNAAMAGREALLAGGNAFDAATATYFALAVTMPSTASLGGGGVCVVYDAPSNQTMALDFLARASSAAGAAKGRPNAVPGNVRGFYALQARYGSLPWSQLVGPAEGMARFGSKISRAFDADLKTVGSALLADPQLRRVFGRAGGGVKREGDRIIQVNLAKTLSGIRNNGVDSIYKGAGARRLAAMVTAAGGSLTARELEQFRPVWRNTLKLPLGDITVNFAPPPTAAGVVAAEAWAMLVNGRRYSEASKAERPHLLAEAFMRAYASRAGWLKANGESAVKVDKLASPGRIRRLMKSYRADRHTAAETLVPKPRKNIDDPSAATFVTVDSNGSAVACALTMNGLFGNGRIAGDSGMLLASVPGRGGRGPAALGPMLAVDNKSGEFFFAAAAAGGAAAPTAMISVALGNLLEVKSLEQSMAAKRLHHSGLPDVVLYEPGYDRAALKELVKRGHRIAATAKIGRVNAIGCTKGLPSDPTSCEVISDGRGFGLGVRVEN